MSDLAITGLLIASLFLILGSGVWIGLALSGVAWIGMELFSARPAGDAMAVGTVILAIAFLDELVLEMMGKRVDATSSEALRNE